MGEEGLGLRPVDRLVYHEERQKKICQLLDDWIPLYIAKGGKETEYLEVL